MLWTGWRAAPVHHGAVVAGMSTLVVIDPVTADGRSGTRSQALPRQRPAPLQRSGYSNMAAVDALHFI